MRGHAVRAHPVDIIGVQRRSLQARRSDRSPPPHQRQSPGSVHAVETVQGLAPDSKVTDPSKVVSSRVATNLNRQKVLANQIRIDNRSSETPGRDRKSRHATQGLLHQHDEGLRSPAVVRLSQPLDVEAVLVSCLAGHLAIILHAGELRPRVDVKFEEHPHDVIVKRENGSGRASASARPQGLRRRPSG